MRYELALVLASFLAGCSQSVVKTDIPGRYVFAHDGNRYLVEIRKNGTYSNWQEAGSSNIWSRSGRWSWDESAPDHKLTFEQFFFENDLGTNEKYFGGGPGFWVLDPERTFMGKVELCFDPDLNDRCFVKV